MFGFSGNYPVKGWRLWIFLSALVVLGVLGVLALIAERSS